MACRDCNINKERKIKKRGMTDKVYYVKTTKNTKYIENSTISLKSTSSFFSLSPFFATSVYF
jgi:hypothetical protein